MYTLTSTVHIYNSYSVQFCVTFTLSATEVTPSREDGNKTRQSLTKQKPILPLSLTQEAGESGRGKKSQS